jgi:hypothetical protein
MSIIDRFHQLEENFYLDSMSESDLDLTEQAEEGEEQEKSPDLQGTSVNAVQQSPTDAALAGGGGEGGMDDAAMGMEGEEGGFGEEGQFGEEEVKDPTELGRIYELNKIYTRLYVINKFLKNTSDEKLQKIKKMVSEAFDIFRLILNNIKSYKEKIDDIILQYYEFISHLVLQLEAYYKRRYNSMQTA